MDFIEPKIRFNNCQQSWVVQPFSYFSKSFEYGLGASAISFDGGHRYLRITDITDYSENPSLFVSPSFFDEKYLLNKGDILLARTGSSTGDSFIFNGSDINTYYAGFLIRAKVEKANPYFIYYQLKTSRYKKWVKIMSVRSGQPGINSNEYSKYKLFETSLTEQNKIVDFLTNFEKQINSQKKLVEKLISLKKGLINDFYSKTSNSKLGSCITETSIRNKINILNVLSVSNTKGFIKQCEQFDDEVASDDLSNYKIVEENTFAYNPARINVGSIARYKDVNKGIVSPMYICFKNTSNEVSDEYLEFFFESDAFKHEMAKRLEGSVRQCLTIGGMKNIPIYIPNKAEMEKLTDIMSFVSKKITNESKKLELLEQRMQFYIDSLLEAN